MFVNAEYSSHLPGGAEKVSKKPKFTEMSERNFCDLDPTIWEKTPNLNHQNTSVLSLIPTREKAVHEYDAAINGFISTEINTYTYGETTSKSILRFISYNCEGFKSAEIETLIKKFKPDGVLLQESKLTNSQLAEHKNSISNFTMEGTSYESHLTHRERLNHREYKGTATLLHESLSRKTVKVIYQMSSIKHSTTHKVKLDEETNLLIINAYFPTRGGTKGYNNRFEEAIMETKSMIQCNGSKKTEFIIFGDMNFDPWSHANDKRRVKLMMSLIKDVNGTYVVTKKPTHKARSREDTWSNLDAAIISRGITLKEMKIIRRDEFPDATRDHYPLQLTISVNAQHERVDNNAKCQPNSWPFTDRKRIKWRLFNKEKYQILSDCFLEMAKTSCHDLPWSIKLKVYNDMISEAAQESKIEKVKQVSAKECEIRNKITKLRKI